MYINWAMGSIAATALSSRCRGRHIRRCARSFEACVGLVECTAATGRTAQARDLFVLERELVVVRNLLVHPDRLLRVDDDLFLRLDRNHFSVTVGLK